VASVLPLPIAAAEDQGAGLAAIVDQVRAVPGAVKRHAYEWAGRSPSGAEEAVAGAGGLALGTKVVVTLCVGAAASGGAAICVNTLGGAPTERSDRSVSKRAEAPRKPKAKPVKAAQAPEPAEPAPEQRQHDEPAEDSGISKSPAPTSSQQPAQQDPPAEFFGGGSSSGGSGQPSASSGSQPAASGSGSAGGSSQGGGGGGSGGEFFGE
jgi:hypothetical protein